MGGQVAPLYKDQDIYLSVHPFRGVVGDELRKVFWWPQLSHWSIRLEGKI